MTRRALFRLFGGAAVAPVAAVVPADAASDLAAEFIRTMGAPFPESVVEVADLDMSEVVWFKHPAPNVVVRQNWRVLKRWASPGRTTPSLGKG